MVPNTEATTIRNSGRIRRPLEKDDPGEDKDVEVGRGPELFSHDVRARKEGACASATQG